MTQHKGAIVVGLDDRADVTLALDWAGREAHVRKRPLHLLRAYRPEDALLPWHTGFEGMIEQDLEAAAIRRLAAAADHVHAQWPDLTVERFPIAESPAIALRDAASQAELTVLAARRLPTIAATLLGSVASAVSASTSGPVVVVGSPPGNPAEEPAVVVGVDGSPATGDVLDFAFDFASRHARPLHAVYCWRPDALAEMRWRTEPPPPEAAERWLAEAVAGWQEKYPDVTVQRAVVREHPAIGLARASYSQELLVVGSRSHRALVATLLGSVSLGVLRHATCPVAVIHPR